MNTGKTIWGIVTGIAAGAALAVLFAPVKGSQLRKTLAGSAQNLAEQGKDILINWKDRISPHHNGNGHHQKSKANK